MTTRLPSSDSLTRTCRALKSPSSAPRGSLTSTMGTSVDARVSSQVLPASVHRAHQPAPAIAAPTSSKPPASRPSALGQPRRRAVSGAFKTRFPR